MRFYFPRTFCYVLTEFARLDCVIISLVIRLTSVSCPRNTAFGKLESSFITRVIDIGVIESRSFDTFVSFTHSLL